MQLWPVRNYSDVLPVVKGISQKIFRKVATSVVLIFYDTK